MLSVTYCDNLLNKKERKYSKEEVKKIRELLYQLAEIDKERFLQKQI